MFCQVSGSCLYKIGHYKALFLKTFSLAVSLNCGASSHFCRNREVLEKYKYQIIFLELEQRKIK